MQEKHILKKAEFMSDIALQIGCDISCADWRCGWRFCCFKLHSYLFSSKDQKEEEEEKIEKKSQYI